MRRNPLKKKVWPHFSEIYLEGNKGGDFIELTQTPKQAKNNTCDLKVGNCCVVVLDATIPVEFITALFARFRWSGWSGGGTLKDRVREVVGSWSDDFVNELCNKVQEK